MTNTIHRPRTREASAHDAAPGPRTRRAFEELRYAIFSEGALDPLTKQLIAVAVAHTTGCPCCITGHTALAIQAGATAQDLTESIWVAAEVHAGGTFAHPTRAFHSDQGAAATSRHRD
jgi:AhpD family alkylhydroperoxidase